MRFKDDTLELEQRNDKKGKYRRNKISYDNISLLKYDVNFKSEPLFIKLFDLYTI